MSPLAIQRFWLERGDKQWNRVAFRRALRRGVEVGDFVKVKTSYRLGGSVRRKERELERRKEAKEYVEYERWLDSQGFYGWQRFEMLIAYEAHRGYWD